MAKRWPCDQRPAQGLTLSLQFFDFEKRLTELDDMRIFH